MGYTTGIKWDYENIKKYLLEIGYYLKTKDYNINSNTKLIFSDTQGYMYEGTIHNLIKDRKPRIATLFNPYSIQNIKLWLNLNNKNFDIVSENFVKGTDKLIWKCRKEDCGEFFDICWEYILQGNECPYCKGLRVGMSNCLYTNNPRVASEWHPSKNGNLTPYNITISSNKKIWWVCINNHEWCAIVNSRTRYNGNNCPYCSGKLPDDINNLYVKHKHLCEEWDYNKNKKHPKEYTPLSNKKVWWICRKCNHSWQAIIYNRSKKHSTGCPNCSQSKGEERIGNFLKNNNLLFEIEYDKFNDLRGVGGNLLRFDFAIFTDGKNSNIFFLCEFDGIQHTKWIKGMIEKEDFKRLQIHDKLKNTYCKNNNIPLLRINYTEFDNIEIILENYINKLRGEK